MDFVIGRSSRNMVRINHNALHLKNLIQILNFTLKLHNNIIEIDLLKLIRLYYTSIVLFYCYCYCT